VLYAARRFGSGSPNTAIGAVFAVSGVVPNTSETVYAHIVGKKGPEKSGDEYVVCFGCLEVYHD
jgi:hypothetical protein